MLGWVRAAWLGAALVVAGWAMPALAAPAGKPIVAIFQMDDVADSGKADEFSRMIETAITATSKFRVIERERLGKLVGEQARAKSGLVTSRSPGKVGGFEGADFLIYGSITSVSATQKADFGSTFLRGLGSSGNTQTCANTVVTISIDIKITDADSGEVKYVTRITESQKSAAMCGATGQVDTAILLRSAADKIATGLVTSIYPIQIAAVQGDGVIVLNYGEGAITVGAVMGVYSKGASIVDPATGEVIGNNETKLGYIRVTDVTGRISRAVAVTNFATPPVVGAIVRPANPAEAQAMLKQQQKKK